jgi:hypothetical protein
MPVEYLFGWTKAQINTSLTIVWSYYNVIFLLHILAIDLERGTLKK